MSKMITVKMTQQQAEMLDIVWCTCGHRPNNHFEHGKRPCAHCSCKKYQQYVRLPKSVDAERGSGDEK